MAVWNPQSACWEGGADQDQDADQDGGRWDKMACGLGWRRAGGGRVRVLDLECSRASSRYLSKDFAYRRSKIDWNHVSIVGAVGAVAEESGGVDKSSTHHVAVPG